ncbi:hypothetical protein HYC85_013548 [Camellia sinensis]|uniref:Uncharacterized protein n=1 Tax=Camellia sinensis TaxID=4442 RepID=A0A7J7H5R0_CAMSI|nr:hypothetical protein HYC85_013548 [Camellia sinensis]
MNLAHMVLREDAGGQCSSLKNTTRSSKGSKENLMVLGRRNGVCACLLVLLLPKCIVRTFLTF